MSNHSHTKAQTHAHAKILSDKKNKEGNSKGKDTNIACKINVKRYLHLKDIATIPVSYKNKLRKAGDRTKTVFEKMSHRKKGKTKCTLTAAATKAGHVDTPA